MKRETNEIRIIDFDWNEEEQFTEGVKERLLKLPKEVEVKREAYHSESMRRQLAQNLMQQLWQDNQYASPDNVDILMNASISSVANLYAYQIVVIKDRNVFLNTVDQGVIYFNLKELPHDKERLELSDFQKLKGPHEEYSVDSLCCWEGWGPLAIWR